MSNTVRTGDWTQTFAGIQFYPFDPRPDEVKIKDIAHALSMICHFNGHTREFFSVAQHSLMVSYLLPAEHKLWGLMHDSAEAYIGDMIRPIKTHSDMFSFALIEGRLLDNWTARLPPPMEDHRCGDRLSGRILSPHAGDILMKKNVIPQVTCLTERWRCTGCALPCEVTICYTDDKLPDHLKGKDRLNRKSCLCGNNGITDWVKL